MEARPVIELAVGELLEVGDRLGSLIVVQLHLDRPAIGLAGVGAGTTVTVTATASATAVESCVNGGDKVPSDRKKTTTVSQRRCAMRSSSWALR